MVASGLAAGPPLPDKPSVAVLPFANLCGRRAAGSGSPTGSPRTSSPTSPGTRDLLVIAHNSVDAYKGKTVDVSQVGRELGVRYVLEGSVQAEADRVRVTAQLIDATTDAHLWAERYDRPAADLFAIQDEITARVAQRARRLRRQARAGPARGREAEAAREPRGLRPLRHLTKER